MKLLHAREGGASLLLLILGFALVGCDKFEKPVKSDDSASVVHEGNRVTVPTKSPLASRLEVEAAQKTMIRRQVTAPASVPRSTNIHLTLE